MLLSGLLSQTALQRFEKEFVESKKKMLQCNWHFSIFGVAG